jgi:hypothetical protein
MTGLPEAGGKIYFGGEHLNWLDLAGGFLASTSFKAVEESKGQMVLILFQQNETIYYKRIMERDVDAVEGKPQQEEGLEIGRLQIEDAGVKPSFTIWEKDFANVAGGAHLSAMSEVSFAPDGRQGVVSVRSGEVEKILLVEENKGIVRELDPGIDLKTYALGALVWSQDRKTLYAPLLTSGETAKKLNYELAEIPVAGGKARMTKIAVVHRELSEFLRTCLRLSMQASVSPDGRWIAATPAVLGKDMVDARDRALFLIDLRDPERHMQRIPIPPQPAEGAAAPPKKAEATKPEANQPEAKPEAKK